MSRLIFPFLASGLCLIAGPLSAASADGGPVTVRAAAVQTLEDGGARVTLTLDRPASARHFTLAGPDRFVVDVARGRVGFAAPPPCGGLVRALRHGVRPDGAARLVFDLSGVASARVEPQSPGSTRLVYRLGGQAEAAVPAVSPTPPAALAAQPPSRRTIVIDAGHGGHDPGALGREGGREKAITLAAALRLRDDLEGRGYRVVLTRDGDAFLPLEARVKIARDNKADLFISLHADANENRNARGASVYTLSDRGGARAKGMMEAQDWDMDLGDEGHSRQVHQILLDLAQRETTNRSADFAQALIAQLGGASPLLRNTHRSAGFFVLLAPDVPAVLIELGFMTNAQDEARLADPGERRRAMGAVADAIDVYFNRGRTYAAR